MYNIKMKHPLYSALIVVCVSHAFDKFGVTSDSSASLGLVEDKTPWSRHGFVSNDLVSLARPRSRRSEQNQSQRTSTEANDYVQNRSSELADLFAVGSRPRSNESITSSSKAKVVTLEGGSYVKTDQIKTSVPAVFNLSLNSSRPSPTPSLDLLGLGLPTNSSLIVPSEGGVLEEGLPHTSTRPTKSGPSEVNLSTEPIKIDGKDTLVGVGLPAREGVSSLVNTQLESQGSHISARKGATLSDQMESANGTVVPLIYTSSKIDQDSNFHTPKITPRKEAEAPKIYPRKGVINTNSSDQFSSDINNNNNNNRTTVSVGLVTARPTTAFSSRLTDNHTEIVKHINTSKAGRPSLQNSSRSTIKDMSEKISSQYVNSESSITPRPASVPTPAMEAITSKSEPTSDAAATNSNSGLNVTMPRPIIDMKNITLDNKVIDKSGIIAYPPLKKRPKPLKTTDIHSVNSSPITPEHSSSEHDYVIPIVVTILTVPMLVVLVLFVYKKGSEFWERRHYRRMDFLIDGMYND